MATVRYYLQNASATYTPTARQGTWTNSSASNISTLNTSKVGTLGSWSYADVIAGAATLMIGRFVSPALAEDALVNFSDAVIGYRQSTSTANMYPQIHIWVTVGDSDTVRGTIVDNFTDSTREFDGGGTNAAGMGLDPTGSAVSAQAGDRIVVEVGYYADTNATSRTGYVYLGGTSSNDLTDYLTAAYNDATLYPGWIDFDITNETIAVDDATHAVTSDTVTLEGDFPDEQDWYVTLLYPQTLAVDDALHAHTADSVDVSQTMVLVVDDATHSVTSDEVDITEFEGTQQEWFVTLATATATLVVDDCAHAVTSDEVALEQHVSYSVEAYPLHTLVVDDASHAVTSDEVTLGVGNDLTVDDATHAVTSDVVVLSQIHNLVVNDSTHAVTSDEVTIVDGDSFILAVDDGTHAVTSDEVALTQEHLIVVDDALHALTSDTVTIDDSTLIQVNDCTHSVLGDTVDLTQLHILAVSDCFHAVYSDSVTFPGVWQERTSNTATWTERTASAAIWTERT